MSGRETKDSSGATAALGRPEAGSDPSVADPPRRLKLVFVTDIVTPYMAAVFEALARQSDLTVVFCSKSGTRAMPWDIGELAFRHRVIDGLAIRRRHPDATDFYLSPRILRAIAAARPDGVVAAGFSIPTAYAALWSRLTGRPFVIHSDGTSASERSYGRAQLLARRMLLRRASAAVANSGPAAERFRELGVAADRLFLARHATRLDPMLRAGENRTYESGQPLRVLGVGRLIPRKGFDRLLRAVARARERGAPVALEVLGSGPEERELRELAVSLGIADHVTFGGFVDQAGLPERYAAAHAFAFPTLEDPFGFVLLEAMAAGLPVVTSPYAGATDDLVADGKNGLVADPHDIEATADALVRLASDADLRARLGRAAHAATLDRTPDAAASGYVRAIAHSLEHPGPAAAR